MPFSVVLRCRLWCPVRGLQHPESWCETRQIDTWMDTDILSWKEMFVTDLVRVRGLRPQIGNLLASGHGGIWVNALQTLRSELNNNNNNFKLLVLLPLA